MACSLTELIGLAIVGLLLFSISNMVRYYAKMMTFILTALISSVLCIPIMLPRPKDWRNALIPAWCMVQAGKIIGVYFDVQGIENINKDKGGVILINHQSGIDLIGKFTKFLMRY